MVKKGMTPAFAASKALRGTSRISVPDRTTGAPADFEPNMAKPPTHSSNA
jgi:hypothetical protein